MQTLGISLTMAQRAAAQGSPHLSRSSTASHCCARLPARHRCPGSGEIRFEGVSLRYDGAKADALADIDLTIAAGTTVALVGPTGSGKTTLAMLRAAPLRPERGRILIDGADVARRSRSARCGARSR